MPSDGDAKRSDPETLLRQVEAVERAAHRGQLKIFLGYASGVGKSFKLFDEGRRRRERGEDVVVGATQDDIPADVVDVMAVFEVIPTLNVGGIPVIDVEALLKRRPAVCLIDGLAYDNPPGSRHPKRYEDVNDLLDAGISVITSVNLEYVDNQQEFVGALLGRTTTQTVPHAFIGAADEVVVVDASPEADSPNRAHHLSLLRQRALLLTADVVDRQLEEYLGLHNIHVSWGTQERIMVCMTPRANAGAMLASGRRNADRFHGELVAVYVNQPDLTPEDKTRLDRNIMLAKAQEAELVILDGRDPIQAILDYARAHGITQLFVGHSLRPTWRTRLTGSLLDRLVQDADGMDVRVFPQ